MRKAIGITAAFLSLRLLQDYQVFCCLYLVKENAFHFIFVEFLLKVGVLEELEIRKLVVFICGQLLLHPM